MSLGSLRFLFFAAILILSGQGSLEAAAPIRESLARTEVQWPSATEWLDVALLRNYNTRLVVLSTIALGIAAGVVGAFLLLRKRSLMGDALAHSTLPGIALAFIIMVLAGGTGKFLPGLIAGATVAGVIGVLLMLSLIHI